MAVSNVDARPGSGRREFTIRSHPGVILAFLRPDVQPQAPMMPLRFYKAAWSPLPRRRSTLDPLRDLLEGTHRQPAKTRN